MSEKKEKGNHALDGAYADDRKMIDEGRPTEYPGVEMYSDGIMRTAGQDGRFYAVDQETGLPLGRTC